MDVRFDSEIELSSLNVDLDQKVVMFSHPDWLSTPLGISQSQVVRYRKHLASKSVLGKVKIVEREMDGRDQRLWIIFHKNQQNQKNRSNNNSSNSTETVGKNFAEQDNQNKVHASSDKPSRGFEVLIQKPPKLTPATTLSVLVEPEILHSLGLPPSLRAKRFIQNHGRYIKQSLGDGSQHFSNLKGLDDILSLWSKSLSCTDRLSPPFMGYITNDSAGNFFGFSPGFPQLIVRDDDVLEGSLAVGCEIYFDEYLEVREGDGLGRVKPKNARTNLPNTPRDPFVVELNALDVDELATKFLNENDGWEAEAPLAIVLNQKTSVSVGAFENFIRSFSSSRGLSYVLENVKSANKYPLTYNHIQFWGLIYAPQEAPESFKILKNADWFGSFPIPKRGKKVDGFNFDWMRAARGRVHDLAHPSLLAEELKQTQNEWILIGDETGAGHELLHADNKGQGVSGSMRKNLAYIWVLVQPNTKLPATPSDFHAMDQKSYKMDHLNALKSLVGLGQNCISFIFESPDFVEEEERHPRGQDTHIPLVIRNTLPIVIDFISKHINSNTPQKIRVMSEGIGADWSPGTDAGFLTSELRKWISNLKDRDYDLDLTLSELQIHPKMDHPWMNYPDAVGFLTGDDVPHYLHEYRDQIMSRSIQLPYLSSFLSTVYPKMVQQLSRKPLEFIQGLIDEETKQIVAYQDPVISDMCMEAFSRFSPIDWRTFNEFMVMHQRRPNGRLIAKLLATYMERNLQQVLETLLSDADRVNLCLTLGWQMEQQGGDVSKYLNQINIDWLSRSPVRMRHSWLSLLIMSKQNIFDFEIRTAAFVSAGLLVEEISDPIELLKQVNVADNTNPLEMALYAKIFTFFAFEKSNDADHKKSLAKVNACLMNYPWPHQRENRRHAIYGAEWALDYAGDSPEHFSFARQRLLQKYSQFLGSGESNRDDPFWWPAAARMYFLGLKYGYLQIDERLHAFLQIAPLYAEQAPLIVRMRVSFWLIKLMNELNIEPKSSLYEALVESEKEFLVDKDVYALLHSSYLMDLNHHYGYGEWSQLRSQFMNRISASDKQTAAYFKSSLEDDALLPSSLLRFNYA